MREDLHDSRLDFAEWHASRVREPLEQAHRRIEHDVSLAEKRDRSSRAWRGEIAFLRGHNIVLDPTMSLFEWLHPARRPVSEIEPGVLKAPPSLRGSSDQFRRSA